MSRLNRPTWFEWIIVAAFLATGILYGVIPLIGQAHAEPSNPGEIVFNWTHDVPEMIGNTTVSFTRVGYTRLREMYLETGGKLEKGDIVEGLSIIKRYRAISSNNVRWTCDIYMYMTPERDPNTYAHEMRHCEGWRHTITRRIHEPVSLFNETFERVAP